MLFLPNSKRLAAKLRKLAAACPLCGNLDADNGPKITRCPTLVCPNYTVERAFEVQQGVSFSDIPPPGTSEHKRNVNPDFNDIHVSYDTTKCNQLDLEEPVRAELRSLLGGPDVFVITVPAPFTHAMIPSAYKRKASGHFTEIAMNGCRVFVTEQDLHKYYANELYQMYLLTDCLTELFSGVGKYIDSGVSKLGYGEIARIVLSKDARQALQLATRYQQDLPLASIQKLESVVLEHGSAIEAYFFAKDVKGSDVKRLESKVLNSPDLHTVYVFAKHVEGADVSAAEQKIIKSGNPKYIRLFLQNVDGANTLALERALSQVLQRTAKKSEA